MKKISILAMAVLLTLQASAAPRFVAFQKEANSVLAIARQGKPINVLFDQADDEGVRMAVENLCADFGRSVGENSRLVSTPEKECIIVGSLQSVYIRQMMNTGKIDATALKDKKEKYLLQVVDRPVAGVDRALVIAGSDKRGTIYGVYELSRQMGVSPWYWWMDVPTERHADVYMSPLEKVAAN